MPFSRELEMNDLPNECLLNILSYLEPLDLLHANFVSTRFINLVKMALPKSIKVTLLKDSITKNEVESFKKRRCHITGTEILTMLKIFGNSIKSLSMCFDSISEGDVDSHYMAMGLFPYCTLDKFSLDKCLRKIIKYSKNIEYIQTYFLVKSANFQKLIEVSPKLKNLDMVENSSGERLADQCLDFTKISDGLEHLSLSHTNFNDIGVVCSLLERIKNLKYINIGCGSVACTQVLSAVTQNLTNLQALHLSEFSENTSSNISEDALKSISNLKNLKVLHLSGPWLPVNFVVISQITSNCKNIKFLELHSLDFCNRSLEISLQNLKNLQVLVIEQIYELTRFIPPAEPLKHLRTLIISFGLRTSDFEFDSLVAMMEKSPLLSLIEISANVSAPLNVVYKIVSIAVSRNQYAVLNKTEYINPYSMPNATCKDHTMIVYKFGNLPVESDPCSFLELTPQPEQLFEGVRYYVEKRLPDCRVLTYQGKMFKIKLEGQEDFHQQNFVRDDSIKRDYILKE